MIACLPTPTDEATALQDYFEQLAGRSSSVLDALPIELTPQPLAYALEALAPAIERMKTKGLMQLRQIPRPAATATEIRSAGVGLNTIGTLMNVKLDG